MRRRNKWNGMKLAAEAEGDVDEDDLEEDEVRSVDSRLPFKAHPLCNLRGGKRFGITISQVDTEE